MKPVKLPAQQLNETIRKHQPNIYAMLSKLAHNIYFPKEGILSQSAEAASKAKAFNATIGIATEQGKPMHLRVIQDTLSTYDAADIYPYAPPAGKPALRNVWKQKLLSENPSLRQAIISNPIVTNALTHGLSIVADLFVDEDDIIILPDKSWENYELTFGIRRHAKMVYYPFYNEEGTFNSNGLRETLFANRNKGKAIVLLNFPSNPTGYTPSQEESEQLIAVLQEIAQAGMHLVVVTDDAYFGLFFADCLRESLFAKLYALHPNILPIKVDGATKEEYVWGFRIGFITYAVENEAVLAALEQKTMGIIRATISSSPHPSQTFILHALQSPAYAAQKQAKFQVLKARADKVKTLLNSGKYTDGWSYYPFNSGYFMCLKLHHVHAETLRTHLLQEYGVGTIARGETDLRVAFSCIEEEQLEQLFDIIYQGVCDLTKVQNPPCHSPCCNK